MIVVAWSVINTAQVLCSQTETASVREILYWHNYDKLMIGFIHTSQKESSFIQRERELLDCKTMV